MSDVNMWHPDIHEREGEKLRFCLIDSYRYFLLLKTELPRLREITSERLTVYILYGAYDILLVAWCTDRTFAILRSHLEARLRELASRALKSFTATRIPVYTHQLVEPLTNHDFLRWRTLEELRDAQLNFETFAQRSEFLGKKFVFSRSKVDHNENVKAFIEIRLGDADKAPVLETLVQWKDELFGIYETDAHSSLFLEVHVKHGGALWAFVGRIREILEPVVSARATTFVVANVHMDNHHCCGFEILADPGKNINRLFSELFPPLGQLEPQEMLLTSAILIGWLGFFQDPDMSKMCTAMASAAVERSRDKLAAILLEVGASMEDALRHQMPAACAELLGKEWVHKIIAEKKLSGGPEHWTMGTRFDIMKAYLGGTSLGLDDAECAALNEFARLSNSARHDRSKLRADHTTLEAIRPALEIMRSRKAPFGVESWQADKS